MVEQPHPGKGHHHVIIVALADDQIIPDGPAGLSDIPHAAAPGPLDVVREGEEGVAGQGHPLAVFQPCPGLLACQGRGALGEVALPAAVLPRPARRSRDDKMFDLQVKNILSGLEDFNNGVPEDDNDKDGAARHLRHRRK